jgi:hypothetical protein
MSDTISSCRSRTFTGIARAMADQWGGVAMEQRGLFR